MSVYLMSPNGRDRRRVCADVMETLAAEWNPTLPGFGTEEQQRALSQLAYEDYSTLVQHELDAQIDGDGRVFVMLDGRELRHDLGSGWFINDRCIDDLATAVHVLLDARHAGGERSE